MLQYTENNREGESMTLSEELRWRGFINQMTFEDIRQINESSLSFYFGVDPSADSMTIGNLAAAMMVRHFVDAGHNAYLLVGGATGMIGDPDGKADERSLKTFEEIDHNKSSIASQYRQIFEGKSFTIVDNYDWFKSIQYLDFLRTIGKHVPMSQMLGRDFIQSRLGEGGSGISYAEFSYALIQGYDFLHLFKEHGVTLQLCGADQWGNSITGVDLIRRIEGKEAHVLSTPLIVNKSTGVKFGKSEGGAVWLDPDKTSVYKFYQFWLNLDDEGVIDYLKIYTLLSREEIEKIATEHAQDPGLRTAQKALAREVTILVHGVERYRAVEKVTDVLFGGTTVDQLDDHEVTILSQEIPTFSRDISTVDVLTQAGFASSNGEARRLLQSGAVAVNGEKRLDDTRIVARSLIRKGKNSFALVR